MTDINIRFEPTLKQFKALEILRDKETTELCYGGAAGGGKTYLGCAWLGISCLQHPASRWFMGRAVLKRLKESTLLTMFGILNSWGFQKDVHYRYNAIEGYITFWNQSAIYLKDLKLYPNDPEFDSFGSTEYTGGFIDECSEIKIKAKEIIKSRLRYKLDEFGLIPKLLIASNPTKNFLYKDFFKPWKENKLPEYCKFLPALVTDNKYISKHYITLLHQLKDEASKQRLLFGNWHFDNDPSKIIKYDAICDLFTNTFVPEGEKAITSDLAMQGRDKFIVMSWSGLRCKIRVNKDISDGKEIETDLRRVAEEDEVPRSKIIADSDGMGNYLESYMKGIFEFKGGKSAYHNEYFNLRSECYFKLAEFINKRKIYIDCNNETIKEQIIEDLEQIKKINVSSDEEKLRIIKKDDIKDAIGRSPDWGDVLMMKMPFEISRGSSEVLSDGGVL